MQKSRSLLYFYQKYTKLWRVNVWVGYRRLPVCYQSNFHDILMHIWPESYPLNINEDMVEHILMIMSSATKHRDCLLHNLQSEVLHLQHWQTWHCIVALFYIIKIMKFYVCQSAVYCSIFVSKMSWKITFTNL